MGYLEALGVLTWQSLYRESQKNLEWEANTSLLRLFIIQRVQVMYDMSMLCTRHCGAEPEIVYHITQIWLHLLNPLTKFVITNNCRSLHRNFITIKKIPLNLLIGYFSLDYFPNPCSTILSAKLVHMCGN